MPSGMSDASPTLLLEAHEFDFLEGEWDAVCRFPRPDGSWGEGPGTLRATKVLDGCVSMEFFEGPYQGELIKGLGLRAFNLKSRCWEHTWTDTSSPGGFHVWRGQFVGGKIDLFAEWTMTAASGFFLDSPGPRLPAAVPTGRATARWTVVPPGRGTG